MSLTDIEIDDELLRKAAELTGLKTKCQIVRRALELLVKAGERKAILQDFGSGVRKGDDLKTRRKDRV